MPKIFDGNKQTLTSGYGTGLTPKQKQSRAWKLDPQVVSTETVAAGNGSGNVQSNSNSDSHCNPNSDSNSKSMHVRTCDTTASAQLMCGMWRTTGA